MSPIILLLRLLLGIFVFILQSSFSKIHNVVEAFLPVVLPRPHVEISRWTAAASVTVVHHCGSSSSSSSSSSMVPISDIEDDEEVKTTATIGNRNKGRTLSNKNSETKTLWKRQLIELCAAYDRGFGASTLARKIIDEKVQQIQQPNDENDNHNNNNNNNNVTIIGNWRMIYTTALDVLSLQASPFFTAGAIYQVYNNDNNNNNANNNDLVNSTVAYGVTTVTNIIDFIPRMQSVIPSFLFSNPPNTLIRAQVQTRACPPKTSPAPNRIGLIFDAVSIQPMEWWGRDATFLPPLQLDLPQLPSFGTASATAAGFFDVTYLDEELLIIRQNAPGGIFCLLRTSSIDP